MARTISTSDIMCAAREQIRNAVDEIMSAASERLASAMILEFVDGDNDDFSFDDIFGEGGGE